MCAPKEIKSDSVKRATDIIKPPPKPVVEQKPQQKKNQQPVPNEFQDVMPQAKSMTDLYDLMSQMNANLAKMASHSESTADSSKKSASAASRIPGARSVY